LSIGTVGEQADNLEATRRAAAYQDCHRHYVSLSDFDFGRCDGRHNTSVIQKMTLYDWWRRRQKIA
jgi:hypothetical protein